MPEPEAGFFSVSLERTLEFGNELEVAEYEELAVGLARDRGRLAGFTERLKANRMTAPLFDTDLFARRLEDAYVQMYERYQDGSPPEYIRVGG